MFQKSQKIELRPCPFCGENDLHLYGDPRYMWIKCKKCKVETRAFSSYKELTTYWNGEMKSYGFKDENWYGSV